jgi:hypothetical protein
MFQRVPVEASERIDKAEGNSKAQAVSVLVELSKEATLNSLMKQLDVEVRLDAMIDRLIKRLLFVRASNLCQPPLQSLIISSALANHAKAA